MKGKSYASRLGALALALTLATTSLIGGTLAKYATEVTGDGSATVAAWSFKANKSSETFTVNLADTDVKEGTLSSGMIAPGTNGSFDIVIDASGSKVGVDYSIKLSDFKKRPENLKFYSDKNFGTEIVIPKENEEVEICSNESIALDKVDTEVKKTVYWKWAYEDATGTTKDTTAGTTAGETGYKGMTFKITVTGTQQNPEPTTASAP